MTWIIQNVCDISCSVSTLSSLSLGSALPASPHYIVNSKREGLPLLPFQGWPCSWLCVCGDSWGKCCEALLWSLWLTLLLSSSSWACLCSMLQTDSKASPRCQISPSSTTPNRSSGWKPPSSRGLRCWLWSGFLVSLLFSSNLISTKNDIYWMIGVFYLKCYCTLYGDNIAIVRWAE